MNGIKIGLDEAGHPFVISQFEKELNINDNEKKVADHFICLLSGELPGPSISLERRADNYLSLCVNSVDFLRFKYTDRTQWIALDIEENEVSRDDPRFAAQKNKNQRFWRANISGLSDLDSFDNLVVNIVKRITERGF